MKQMNQEQLSRYSCAIRNGFIDPAKPNWHSFCGTWIRKHPGRTSTLKRLKDILGRNPEWSDMNDDLLSDLKEDMLAEMAPNSVRTICAELKAVLNSNKATKPIQSETFNKILRSKKVPSQAVYLTTTELKRFHMYQPRGVREQYVKQLFMLECLTGARSVDCRRLTTANIHQDEEGNEFIVYVPQKHPVEVTVPVHKWLKSYLRYNWPQDVLKARTDHLDRVLRDMCRRCGINTEVSVYHAGKNLTGPKYKFIASHTGRRTFATQLSLKGCPLEQIAIMMGHVSGNTPNIAMTSGYICAKKKISKNVLAMFH